MLKQLKIIAVAVSAFMVVSCENTDSDDKNGDTDSTTDTSTQDSDTLIDSDTTSTDTDADTDSNIDTDIDTDIDSDSDTDSDHDTDSSSDSNDCNGQEPYCAGNAVVTCNDGEQVHTECETGTFCNWGECELSNVNLPTDAGPHNYKTEWWYYTGHVSGSDKSFGYEITIFK